MTYYSAIKVYSKKYGPYDLTCAGFVGVLCFATDKFIDFSSSGEGTGGSDFRLVFVLEGSSSPVPLKLPELFRFDLGDCLSSRSPRNNCTGKRNAWSKSWKTNFWLLAITTICYEPKHFSISCEFGRAIWRRNASKNPRPLQTKPLTKANRFLKEAKTEACSFPP